MKRARRRPRTSLAGNPPLASRVEAVVSLLPTNGDQVQSSWLIRRLYERLKLPRRTAIRWLKESERYIPEGHHYPLVKAFKWGKHRLYGFNLTGFMDPTQAEFFLRGAPIAFLREGPKLVDKYNGSFDSMTLFWKQASSTLVLSLERVIGAAQSVTFAQVHDRVHPSVEVARAQADVLTDVFVKPWVRDLVASLHQFLESQREQKHTARRPSDGRPVPGAMNAYQEGWDWAIGPEGAASRLWIAHMKGPASGPWGEFLEQTQREEEERTKAMFAKGQPDPSSSPS